MASNRFRGIVEITLDKPRHLRYTLNSLIALEERAKISLVGLETAPKTPALLRDILWAGLIHEDPGLTVEAVGNLVGVAELGDLWEAVTRGLEASLTPPGETSNPGMAGAERAGGAPGLGKKRSRSPSGGSVSAPKNSGA